MDTRLVLGLSIDWNTATARCAVTRVLGLGLNCQAECVASHGSLLDDPIFDSAQSSPKTAGVSSSSDRRAALQDRLGEIIRTAVGRSGSSMDRILAVGLITDGDADHRPISQHIAAWLAEQTGSTVVSGFSDRDRLANGSGRLLATVVDWLLCRDERRCRIVVHADGCTSVCHIPSDGLLANVRATETGPGLALINRLAVSLSNGTQRHDLRGMLAVQGRQLKPLLLRWTYDAFLRLLPPKELGEEHFGQSFIDETFQLAVDRGWALTDVLCSATHFVASCPADAVERFYKPDPANTDIVLVGAGASNGFLLRFLEEHFSQRGLKVLSLPKIGHDSYGAVSAAILGCLTLDGVEANLPAVTRATGLRLLGHITPGTSQNWRQCVDWMHRAGKSPLLRAG